MARSFALGLYLGATRLLAGWAQRRLAARARTGKEDPARLNERLGRPAMARPDGPLVWFHAASVGESLSVLGLVDAILARPAAPHVLITTGTRTSAELLASRLPPGALHQFVPVDTPEAVRGFLDHWRPDLAIWTESELWPRLITQTAARGTPMVLVNGRMSETSARRWRWLGRMPGALLENFAAILVQEPQLAERFVAVGAPKARCHVTGSLKSGAPPPPVDADALAALTSAIGTRPVWLAASTHPQEEAPIIAAHRQMLRALPDLLLILVPRHPERGREVADLLAGAGLAMVRRSAGEMPGPATEVYLCDTLGEMGLWYSLAPVSFVGGSLVPVGGHNPYEPAALGSAILHGPYVYNFDEIYARLSAREAALLVGSAPELAAAVETCLASERGAQLIAAAKAVLASEGEVIETVLAHLAPYLPAKAGRP